MKVERQISQRETLFADHQGQATAIASVYFRQYSGFADHDELVNAALFGLWQATESFDSKRGIPFHAWAKYRIKGAILDEVRLLGGVSRGRRKEVETVAFGEGQDAVDEPLESHDEWDKATTEHAVVQISNDARLSPRERATLAATVAGISHKEAAESLGTSYSSFMVSWGSARRKIKTRRARSAAVVRRRRAKIAPARIMMATPAPQPVIPPVPHEEPWTYVPPHLRRPLHG